MTKKLKPEILETLEKKTNKTAQQIRPRISEIRRKHSGLTLNAAAQMYALDKGTSVLGKLDSEDRQSLASVQSITQINSSHVHKYDKRTVNIHNSQIHNLLVGDRNSNVNQNVTILEGLLTDLVSTVENSSSLSEDEKNDYKSDIQALASQLGKKKPNKKVIAAAWDSVKGLSAFEGFLQLIERIEPYIQSCL